MSFFFKDPKTCMNPWHGLAIIMAVCFFVMIVLLIGGKRYSSSQYRNQQTMSSPATVSPTVY